MNPQFRALVDALHPKYEELPAMQPRLASHVPPRTPIGGVYLFSEHGIALYAGRTKRRISVRIRNQFGANPQAASFPWLLAREATAMTATYKPTGSRADLLANPQFRAAYDEARARIRHMHVRYVHEPEPLQQALLEMYVAVSAQTKYNDFGTH